MEPMDGEKRDYYDIGRVRTEAGKASFGQKPVLQRPRLVARDKIGDVVVSTIKMSRDVTKGTGPPKRFQTLVMGGKFHMFKTYSSTPEEAQKRHVEVTEKIKLIEEVDFASHLSLQHLKSGLPE